MRVSDAKNNVTKENMNVMMASRLSAYRVTWDAGETE